eukprot:CAMPEP_0170935858 /NCGR_PEP_ID=MMETSP0735-20130129/19388_1 /TAXON_ID=186038 /ORGANISM="Fragilariopsis kerguelensis, Strain L26-C5" /LENGTH=111 /DNA_ID=CAMNT_0011339727 /DNA_START=117 /DNA_END=449 /DNA_ORIENTATION=-
MRLSPSLSSSLMPSSSSPSSSSGQESSPTNSRSWKNKINKKKKLMAKVIATSKVTVMKEKKKKAVRFQLPLKTHDASAAAVAAGSHQRSCLKRGRYSSEGHPNTWYTSQEL